MNYTEAVKLALNGDEKGYNILYERTYKSKYYLALKYMQNEDDAKDVLQEAYIKAFTKLDTLENPEKFCAWFGMIVANTAKNALKKRNPILFTDISVDSEEDEFEYEIEDKNIQNQPEIAYSQKETQELVRELIDSLSEEQRMCILMFHIEGQCISEIANILECSENTVKSRLSYGRKNIKLKAEELQKKGYKLYSLAPIPLLLYLLKSEENVMAAEGVFEAVEETMAGHIMDSVAKASIAKTVGAKVSSEAVKQGFIHTMAGKVVAAGIGICIVAAGITGVVINSQKNSEDVANTTVEETDVNKEDKVKETDTKTEEKITEQDVTDEQYSSLLAGNITKGQFEFILAYGPEYMTDRNPSIEELSELMFRVATTGQYEQIGLEGTNVDSDGWLEYNISEVNNFISVLTAYTFTEQDNDKYQSLKVSGDTVSIIIAEPSSTQRASIQKAKLKEDKMTVEYQVETLKFDSDGEEQRSIVDKKAVLGKLSDGTFRIISIADNKVHDDDEEKLFGILPDTFWFLSGAGAWATELHINGDGSFFGQYHDSDAGSTGEGYPNGTRYICNFTGRFVTPTKLNDYTYSTKIEYIEQEKTEGEEYYEDGIKYIVSEPYGLENADEILIYLPKTPITELSQEFISWAFYGEPETENLGCYGLYNVRGGEGFTGSENE